MISLNDYSRLIERLNEFKKNYYGNMELVPSNVCYDLGVKFADNYIGAYAIEELMLIAKDYVLSPSIEFTDDGDLIFWLF